MNRYFFLPLGLLSLCIVSSSYANSPDSSIRKADVALIQALEREKPNNQFAEDKKYFFQDQHPAVAVEEKTIEEILNAPASISGLISINHILAASIEGGEAFSLGEAEYLKKLRGSLGMQKSAIAPEPKDWTYVSEHSRLGTSK